MDDVDQADGAEEPVLARLEASQPRRYMGIGMQVVLGGFLISLAISFPREEMALRLLLLVLGGGAFWFAYRMWQATETALVLTKTALRDNRGRLLAEIGNVRELSRGAFALKPSHGFSLVLHRGDKRAWVPGIWWRSGKRVGIGGVTPSQPARYMAELISALIVQPAE